MILLRLLGFGAAVGVGGVDVVDDGRRFRGGCHFRAGIDAALGVQASGSGLRRFRVGWIRSVRGHWRGCFDFWNLIYAVCLFFVNWRDWFNLKQNKRLLL